LKPENEGNEVFRIIVNYQAKRCHIP